MFFKPSLSHEPITRSCFYRRDCAVFYYLAGRESPFYQILTLPMINIQKHLDMLGLDVEDRVTGFKGVVTSISFDLFGCIQAVVNPGTDKEGKVRDSHYFDVNRLEILSHTPVMRLPDFDLGPIAEGRHGPAEKPAPCKP